MNYLILLVVYLIASMPSAFIVGKFSNINILEHGSGNVGTSNVYRTLGLKSAIIVYALDLLKSFVPTLLIKIYFNHLLVYSAILILIGHSYSIFLKFKGGKGIAVSSGVLLAINPFIYLFLFVLQFATLKIIKIMSISSIISAVSFVILMFLVYNISSLFFLSIFMFCFILFQHRDNIKRIIDKKENKII